MRNKNVNFVLVMALFLFSIATHLDTAVICGDGGGNRIRLVFISCESQSALRFLHSGGNVPAQYFKCLKSTLNDF